jgi:ADP-ribosylglycohydrolase
MNTDRARGALLGLAVGDALGTTYEFERIRQPAYPALAIGPATDIVGGGPFGLEPGCVTDDTQLAVCLARSLAARGRLDPADLGARYVAWSQHAFDIGNQTGAALRGIEQGVAPAAAGLAVWRESGRRAAGNGSLMRTAPIAVAYAKRYELCEAALVESMITHADPRCALACACLDVTIAFAITNGPDMVLAVARKALAVAAHQLAGLWRGDDADRAAIAAAEADLGRDLDAAASSDPGVYGDELHIDRTAGFVRVAFRLAFWHALHTRSWRDAVVDVASRGGDADTNAAIVGALMGACTGASGIPPAWIERVLGATLPGPLEWANDHHPRHLLALT